MLPLLRAEEAAALLGVTRARCYSLVRSGMLPVVRMGRQIRIDPTQLQEWLANGGRRLEDGDRGATS